MSMSPSEAGKVQPVPHHDRASLHRYRGDILAHGEALLEEARVFEVLEEFMQERLGSFPDAFIAAPQVGKDGTVHTHLLWNRRDGRVQGMEVWNGVTITARPLSRTRQIVVKGEGMVEVDQRDWQKEAGEILLRQEVERASENPRIFHRDLFV